MRRACLLGAVLIAVFSAAFPAAAQTAGNPGGGPALLDEGPALREAAAFESRGDLGGAERVLRGLLGAAPTSTGALFALERILRARGQPSAILAVADTFLAHDPGSAGVRYLKLRVLAELDSLPALAAEAERWLAVEPRSEAPYREVARLFENSFGPARALEVLRRGQSQLEDPTAFALEIGDQLAATGQLDAAVAEWALALREGGVRPESVSRRVIALPSGGAAAGRSLVAALSRAREPTRWRIGALLALDLRLENEALSLGRRGASDMSSQERVVFLTDVARRAREGNLSTVAAWAYGELGSQAASPIERRQFEMRIVEMSLATGDTAAALAAHRRVAASFPAGSAERRRASAEAVRLEGASAAPERVREILGAFRVEFPEAPELDELAAAAAGNLLAKGDFEGAASLLEGLEGPKSALQRGYLLIGTGDIEAGRQALFTAAPGLSASAATDVIQLASLFGRLSPPATALVARAALLDQRGQGAAAAVLVEKTASALPEADRASVLAEGARMAERVGLEPLAAQLRQRILNDHPGSPEAAEASLSFARYRAQTPEGRSEAIRILEDLVTRSPESAVVPDARRELERLKGRG